MSIKLWILNGPLKPLEKVYGVTWFSWKHPLHWSKYPWWTILRKMK